MRPDALALLLSRANIHAGIRAVVCESTSGLVTTAMLERMAGVLV